MSKQLSTDAAALPPRDEDQQENSQQHENNNRSLPAILTLADNATPKVSLLTSKIPDKNNHNLSKITSNIEEISTPGISHELTLNSSQHYPLLPLTDQRVASNIQNCQVFQFSNINKLHLGSVNNISVTNTIENVNARGGTSLGASNSTVYKKTKTIQEMMASKDRLELDSMDIISTHLGEDWRSIARQLGFSDGQIEQKHEDNYVKGVKETFYQILLDWTRDDNNATLGHIVSILWRSDKRDVVYQLKVYWKRLKSDNLVNNNKPHGNDNIQ